MEKRNREGRTRDGKDPAFIKLNVKEKRKRREII